MYEKMRKDETLPEFLKRRAACERSAKFRERHRERCLQNTARIRENKRRSQEKNKGKRHEYFAKYYAEHKEERLAQVRESGRVWRQRLKDDVISQYGGKCVCCGETEKAFLCMDHINGGGSKHRKELVSQGFGHWYLILKRQDYPKDYQVLCFNCNMAKQYNGVCPHKEEKDEREPCFQLPSLSQI